MQTVDSPKVALLFPTREIAQDAYRQMIYTACRTCYSEQPPDEIWSEVTSGQVSDRKMQRLIERVVASGHHSTIEHIVFSFAISGVSRTMTHQLVRHRIGVAFDQQSQRYVSFQDPQFIVPESVSGKPEACELVTGLVERAAETYQQLLQMGVPAEDARFVFPQGVGTALVMTVNLRELIHMCGLRLCTLAQWEIREVFKQVRREVLDVSPFLGRMLTPHCVHEGFCTEMNNRDGHCRIRPHRDAVLDVWERYRRGELVEPVDSGAEPEP